MKKLSVLLALLTIIFINAPLHAQGIDELMQSEAKINVVITVAFIVLAIMAAWLFRIEWRLAKMEREEQQKHS
jgi:protein-S-isoprenylcysteine O-methyltransferase Ste14